jgi:hypothetical protein
VQEGEGGVEVKYEILQDESDEEVKEEVKLEHEIEAVFANKSDGEVVVVKEEYGTGVGLSNVEAVLEVLDRVDGSDSI